MLVACLTPKTSLLVKASILKFNQFFILHVYKLLFNTLREFEVDHSCFIIVSMIHTHNIGHSKNNIFVVKKPKTGLSLNSIRYFGIKLWSSVPEVFKT